ncbi:uncharacterized protein LOC21407433 [Morus notabilis]|uniref:uncharacterized protein LOC21407433 n=1 Tax=Morus notabilis TaxID=981085 RepID=UPI000CECFF7D|nr:uncharacterized protein LOC21407433 [Morus notabilis]
MAGETQHSDSLSSLIEEGDSRSPPEIVSSDRKQDLIVQQDSSTKSSPKEGSDSAALIPNSEVLIGDESISISDLIVKKNGKETSFSDSIPKEEDQESSKLNGGGSIGILGFSEADKKQEFGKKRELQLGSNGSLEIQVIDETALIGSISMPKLAFKKNPKEEDTAEDKKNKKNKTKRETMTRRKENGGGKTGTTTEKKKKKEEGKMRYSREVMEALRFVNIVEQRRMWKDVHIGLGPLVGKEYDFLLSSKQQNNNIQFIFPQAQENKNHSSSDSGVLGARGRLNHVNVYAH